MEKTIRFYANGKDLKDVLVTQNEKGWYYTDSKEALIRTILKLFDTLKLPSGAKKNINGSHKSYLKENAIDFSIAGGVRISSNKSLKLNSLLYLKNPKTGKNYELPYGMTWVYGDIHFLTDHVKTSLKVGQRSEEGHTLCTVLTQAENKKSGRFDNDNPNGFPPHLHFGTIAGHDEVKVREFILANVQSEPTPPPVTTPPTTPANNLEKLKIELEQLKTDYKKAYDLLTDKTVENNTLSRMYNQRVLEIADIASMLGIMWEDDKKWDDYRYTFLEIIENLKADSKDIADMTLAEIVRAVFNKVIGRK